MNKYRIHKEKFGMKNIESYIRLSEAGIKDTNPRTLELWNNALSKEEYSEIIPLKEGGYLVDVNLYTQLLEACSYNKDLDPYNIPNVNFTLIERGDDRWDDFKSQRLERGFDESETWSLDSTISRFIEPRLKAFKEYNVGYPGGMTTEQWNEILDKMIKAFGYINNDETFDHQDEVSEGLDLFRKYFFDLWW